MDANRFPRGRRAAVAERPLALRRFGVRLLGALAAWGILASSLASVSAAREPLRDEPVRWEANDRGNIPKPKKRDPSLIRDMFDEAFVLPIGRFFNPVRLARHAAGVFGGTEVAGPAADVNELDEALSSSWFTNRIGLYPMTAAEVARGPATVDGPDRSAPWKVVRAKTEGVTAGFNVKDARGDTYVVKFDPPCCPGSTTAAGVIAGRLFHAAGYNVPEDFVIHFRREDLHVGEGVQVSAGRGKRTMTEADIDTILTRAPREPDGTWRAIASKYLPGSLLGPFDWKDRRGDDPFDRVKHQNRRTLRGLRMICAWLAHFDTKQGNTQDSYVTEGDKRYVKHFLFDFTATLGTGGNGPFPLSNFEYGADFSATGGRLLALGLHEDDWRRLTLPPGMPEFGYFEADLFDPMEWKPLQPNAAFANMTERDGYWGAKIVSSFRRDQLEAAVAEGKYRNPEAARLMVRMLEARRDKVARVWFDRVPPLDFFTWNAGTLRFHDLGAERGIYPGSTPRYRVRVAECDAGRDTGAWSEWRETGETSADLAGLTPSARGDARGRPFLAVDAAVSRGGDWSRAVRVYIARASGRVVAVDR